RLLRSPSASSTTATSAASTPTCRSSPRKPPHSIMSATTLTSSAAAWMLPSCSSKYSAAAGTAHNSHRRKSGTHLMSQRVLLSQRMPRPRLTRRNFLALSGATLVTRSLPAQNPTARINVADAERPRILAEAPRALAAAITTITAAPHTPPNTFVSEVEPERGVSDPHTSNKLFRAHAVALRNTSVDVACLSAAYILTRDEQYARRAGAHLRAWFVTENTR